MNKLEIVKQEVLSKEGNDCLIELTYVIFKVSDKFIFQRFCRYRGWCDDGNVNVTSFEQFDDLNAANKYLAKIKNKDGFTK